MPIKTPIKYYLLQLKLNILKVFFLDQLKKEEAAAITFILLDRSKVVTLAVVVVLLFYVHGKHLRSCRDGQLT